MIGLSFVLMIFLKIYIRNINWDVILHLDADDPSLSLDIFYNTIKCLLDKHAPLKRLSTIRRGENPTTLGLPKESLLQ